MLEIYSLTFCFNVFYSFTNEDTFKATEQVSEQSGYIPNATVANGNSHHKRETLAVLNSLHYTVSQKRAARKD